MTTSEPRERNRRGEGGRLRAEILAAASALLEESGSEEAVTLRAVARGVGISAPSIYAHFPDREAIVEAVVDEAFGELSTVIGAAIEAETEPRRRLRAGCAAYLRFAEERPGRYRLLFGRRLPTATLPSGQPVAEVRTAAFDLLVAAVRGCVEGGSSASTDPFGDATAIWVALHGYALLRFGLPGFPWPGDDALLDRIVDGLARLTPPA